MRVTYSGKRSIAVAIVALSITGMAGRSAQAAPLPAGTAYAWGANFDGQLGDGTTTGRTTPVPVHLPAGTYTAVAAGEFHSLALAQDGHVLSWGNNQFGQLGDGTTVNRTTPDQVSLPAGVTVKAIAAGAYQSLALASDGRVFAWGGNQYGQLGDGTTANSPTPAAVHLPAGTCVYSLGAGGVQSLAALCDGRALAWGGNMYGQLGNGSTGGGSTTPVFVHMPAGAHAVAVAGGDIYTLAVTCDGHVLGWGNNFQGQLGNGTTTSSTTPVRAVLPAGTFAAAVSAGDAQGLAIANP